MFGQAAIGLLTSRFELLDACIDMAQRFLNGCHEIRHRVVFAVELASSLRLDFFQCGAGEGEERLRMTLQRFRRQRLEGVAQVGGGLVEKGQFFSRGVALVS